MTRLQFDHSGFLQFTQVLLGRNNCQRLRVRECCKYLASRPDMARGSADAWPDVELARFDDDMDRFNIFV